MPIELANFFIALVTDKGDLVLDPFAGSNTTGYAAETMGRRWRAIEINSEYANQAKLRFKAPGGRTLSLAAE
jgi:site-specific DNA-methyltransferase (cytosine-N4-specific)